MAILRIIKPLIPTWMLLTSIVHVQAQAPAPATTAAPTPAPAVTTQDSLGGLCGTRLCGLANSECRSDGSGFKRCFCKSTFVRFPNKFSNGTVNAAIPEICAKVISSVQDPTCKTCEDNEGKCISILNDNKKSGCACLVSRSGTDCVTIHANVTCNFKNMTMTVCFNNPTYNFSITDTSMRTNNGQTDACMGTPSDGTTCPTGFQQLVLSIKDADLATCRIMKITDAFTTKFTTTIGVHDGSNTAPDIMFNTFCSHDNYFKGFFPPLVAEPKPQNDRGEAKKPNITFWTKFQSESGTFEDIPVGIALRDGDIVKYELRMALDGTYGNFRVEMCSFSGYADPRKFCQDCQDDVILNGCPVTGQSKITNSNTFRVSTQSAGSITSQATGDVVLKKYLRKFTLFLHCTVKTCLLSDPTGCIVKNATTCPAAPASTASGRRKRAADGSQRTIVTAGIKVYNEKELENSVIMKTGDFAGMLAVLLAIIIILAIACTIFAIKSNSHSDKVSDVQAPVGNHFALPRIKRNDMKI